MDEAWTIPQMEEAVRKQEWSLAADYGFYNFLKDFSERIFEKTRNTQRELEGLMCAVDAAETQVNNAYGALDVLSLNQFVERRIEVQDVAADLSAQADAAGEKPHLTAQEAVRHVVAPKFIQAFKSLVTGLRTVPPDGENANPVLDLPFAKPVFVPEEPEPPPPEEQPVVPSDEAPQEEGEPPPEVPEPPQNDPSLATLFELEPSKKSRRKRKRQSSSILDIGDESANGRADSSLFDNPEPEKPVDPPSGGGAEEPVAPKKKRKAPARADASDRLFADPEPAGGSDLFNGSGPPKSTSLLDELPAPSGGPGGLFDEDSGGSLFDAKPPKKARGKSKGKTQSKGLFDPPAAATRLFEAPPKSR
jgi:hypothetical protein